MGLGEVNLGLSHILFPFYSSWVSTPNPNSNLWFTSGRMACYCRMVNENNHSSLQKNMQVSPPPFFFRTRLLDSDKANTYLDELSYEAVLFFPRARAARRKDPLLPSNVSVYINSTTLPPDLATSLVSKAGGQVTRSVQEADIILSNTPMNLTAITVTENWLLDSIEHWRCK